MAVASASGRRPHVVHHQLDALGGQQLLAQRLVEEHRGRRVVADDPGLLDRPVVLLGEIGDEVERLLGLQRRDRRGLERVLEAALGDAVGVGEREPRHLQPLGHLGHAQGERADSQEPMPALIFSRVSTRCAALTAFSTLSPASASRSTILAPPERLDPALAVDLLDRHVGAHLLELALACPAAGQRRDQRDLDVVGGGRRANEEHRDDEGEHQRDDEHAGERTHHCSLLQGSGQCRVDPDGDRLYHLEPWHSRLPWSKIQLTEERRSQPWRRRRRAPDS